MDVGILPIPSSITLQVNMKYIPYTSRYIVYTSEYLQYIGKDGEITGKYLLYFTTAGYNWKVGVT